MNKQEILPIIAYPNPLLRVQCQDIKKVDEEIQILAKKMIATMQSSQGIGLAAPQIGKEINIIIVDDGSGPDVYINPKILFKSFKKTTMEEGCLSILDVYGLVKRPEKIWLAFKNLQGKIKVKTASGLKARILQHEIDHLHGILFIDKTEKITKGEKVLLEYEKDS